MQLHITYEKSGGLHLAEPGLTAGRQAGSSVDEIWARFQILKDCCKSKCSLFSQGISNFDAFLTFFQVNTSTIKLFNRV